MKSAIAVLLLGLALLPNPQDKRFPDFELRYFAVHGRRQHTQIYDFNGDGRKDILNTSIDYDVEPPVRWFLLHVQNAEGGFSEKPDHLWPVPDEAAAIVLGDHAEGGGVDIGYASPDGIWYHPWTKLGPSEEPKKLLHFRTFFREASDRALPLWSVPEDLDGDKRHDIIVPVPDGYRIYFQTEPGIYGKIVELESDLKNKADKSVAIERFADQHDFIAVFFGGLAEMPRLAAVDINGDGLKDLVTIDGMLLTVFFQKKGRLFPSRRPSRIRLPVTALRDKTKKDTVSLSMVSLVDLDGDSLADLIVTKIEGTLGFLESIKTNMYVHRGTGRGNFIADSVIKIDGISIDPMFGDMNRDGTVDVLVSRLRTDILAQAVKAALLGDLAISYEVFQFEKRTGRFVETPVYNRDVYVRVDDIQDKGAASIPMIHVKGDHSGDGRPDMVYMNPKTDEIELRLGVDSNFGSRKFIGFKSSAFWKRRLRRFPNGIHVGHVNSDDIADVILEHKGTLGVVLSKKR